MLRTWDVSSGDCTRQISVGVAVQSVALCGDLLVCGGWEGTLSAWSLEGAHDASRAADLDADAGFAELRTLVGADEPELAAALELACELAAAAGLRSGVEHEVTLEEGKTLILGLQSISEPDERGFRTVMATVNGQIRPVAVRDTSVSAEVAAAEKADPGTPGHVAAPFQGVVSVVVEAGQQVEAGETVATIEAMKMEAAITAPMAGTVQRVALSGTQAVDGGDLVVVLSPA